MKNNINLSLTCLLAAAITAGCNKESTDTGGANSTMSTNDASMTASNAWQSTKEASSNAWDATKSGATNAWENTKEAGSAAWQKTKDAFSSGYSTNEVSTNYFGYDYSQKDSFVSEAKASLDDLDQRASGLSNRLATASDNTKAGLQQTLQDIKDKRADLDKKLSDIKSASQDNWNDAKAGFTKAYYDLKADLKAGWDSVTSKM